MLLVWQGVVYFIYSPLENGSYTVRLDLGEGIMKVEKVNNFISKIVYRLKWN